MGCHFHFTSAIYKKVVEVGLKKAYSGNQKFKEWVRMLFTFPFLRLDNDDIDECWDELKSDPPNLDNENPKVEEFIAYFENTSIKVKQVLIILNVLYGICLTHVHLVQIILVRLITIR